MYKKTLPYVILQLAIGIAFAVLGVIYLSFIGWLGYRFLFGSGGASLLIVGIVMIIGFVTYAFIWRLIQKYFLYSVKTGHVAVIAHIVEEGEVPDNQISYGMREVKDYFVETTALFTVSMVIDAVLKQFNRAVARVEDLIPIPLPKQLQTLITILQKSIVLAVKYLDNAIIAYMFVDRNDNRWKSARDGIVLYGKTWKMVLGSTLLIVFGMYVVSFVLLTLAAPLAVGLDLLPTSLELVSWLVVGGVIAVFHTGVFKPWVKTVVITTFLIEQRDTEPDNETMEWIASHSDRFKNEVMEKAENNEPIAEEAPETGGPSETPAESGSDPADD
ncbi:hypothetical protein C446_17624 [Halobiforma nitratireducens JCM 10879]|uniref:Uncharacterized protein n=1 Tax=Halobiforma nitratireducens JCM 10879 TaxID=1227454 RepID=M0L6L7_9EURY|nr:hypothetical protein C446_17624 [Halobiforma nitratireducens JCM 10879]